MVPCAARALKNQVRDLEIVLIFGAVLVRQSVVLSWMPRYALSPQRPRSSGAKPMSVRVLATTSRRSEPMGSDASRYRNHFRHLTHTSYKRERRNLSFLVNPRLCGTRLLSQGLGRSIRMRSSQQSGEQADPNESWCTVFFTSVSSNS